MPYKVRSAAWSVLLLMALANVSTAWAQEAFAPLYGQCGGVGWCAPAPAGDTPCRTCLGEGVECVRSNEWYWQCLAAPEADSNQNQNQDQQPSDGDSGAPSSDAGSQSPPDSDESTVPADDDPQPVDTMTPEAFAPLYGQCGGVGWCAPAPAGDTPCRTCLGDGVECVRSNEWYWQCLAAPEADSNQNQNQSGDQQPDPSTGDSGGAPPSDSNEPTVPDDVPSPDAENQTPPDSDGGTVPADDDPQPVDTVTPEAFASLHGQCGGQNFCGEGPEADTQCRTCLGEGVECIRGNQWYWQCLPAPEADSNQNQNQDQQPSDGDSGAPSPDAGSQSPPDSNEPAIPTPDPGAQDPIPGGETGYAKTTTFFDGCKPSCAWPSNVRKETHPDFPQVTNCGNTFDENNQQSVNQDPNLKNVCSGGGNEPLFGGSVAYSCVNRQPWTDTSGQKYAFAAANSLETCCQCYELTFLQVSLDSNGVQCSPGCSAYGGEIEGETLVIQVINTGGDLGVSQFDLMIPGGGFGIFNGVAGEEPGTNGPPLFPDSDPDLWGQRFGGVGNKDACGSLPQVVQAGCEWQFDELLNADNPGVFYRRVSCALHPGLVEKSGCLLAEDTVSQN